MHQAKQRFFHIGVSLQNPPQFPPPQVTPGLRLEELLPNEFPFLEQTFGKKMTQILPESRP